MSKVGAWDHCCLVIVSHHCGLMSSCLTRLYLSRSLLIGHSMPDGQRLSLPFTGIKHAKSRCWEEVNGSNYEFD